jgi:outer membrane protein
VGLRIYVLCLCSLSSIALAETVHTNDSLKRQSLTANPPESQPPLDLKTAVGKAVENNNAILQARHKIDQDAYDTKAVRSLLFPSVNAVFQRETEKSAVLTNPNATPFGGSAFNQYVADLKFTQPLFAWGSLSAVRVANFNRVLNELDLEIAVRTLSNNVIQAFYQVLLNQRLLEILERTQTVVNESLATAQSRLRTGRGQLLDVLQVKTQMALLKPQIESAHNQLESAGAQLATYLSEQGKYELQVEGTLKGLFLKDVQKHMDFKNAHLPELERVRVQREQLGESRDVTLGGHLPNLSLQGDYGYISPTQGDLFTGNAHEWSAMLVLNIPLFSGLQSLYQMSSLDQQDHQLEYQGRDLENTLALNQVQSLKSLQSTGASLVSAEEAADLADQSMAEARRNYRLATIDFVQFLTVEQNMLQADSSLDNIRYQNIAAFANYFVATGQPLSTLIDLLEERNR